MHFRSSVQSLALLNYHDSGRILIARSSAHGGILLTSRGLSKEEEHLLPLEKFLEEKEAAHKTASPEVIQVPFPSGWSPTCPPALPHPWAGGFSCPLPSAAPSPLADKLWAQARNAAREKRPARFFIPHGSIYAGVVDVQGHCSQLSCCIWIPDTENTLCHLPTSCSS